MRCNNLNDNTTKFKWDNQLNGCDFFNPIISLELSTLDNCDLQNQLPKAAYNIQNSNTEKYLDLFVSRYLLGSSQPMVIHGE